jgi:hypothetical protein
MTNPGGPQFPPPTGPDGKLTGEFVAGLLGAIVGAQQLISGSAPVCTGLVSLPAPLLPVVVMELPTKFL